MKAGLGPLYLAILLFSCAAAARAGSGPASGPVREPDPERGREVYVEKGCYACHGYDGQGGIAGPKIAPSPMPLEDLTLFIRNSGPTAMPAYSEKLISDDEIADVHAWLATRPSKRASDIPLLSPSN